MDAILGSLDAVWTPWAFGLAILIGLAFGRALGPILLAPATRANWAWAVWFIFAAWITCLVLSQVVASLITGDPAWVRILSRLAPYLAGAAATGVGVWLGRPKDRGTNA